MRAYSLRMAIPELILKSHSPEGTQHPVEGVWDSLAADPVAVPRADWLQRELDQRLHELIREGPIGILCKRVLGGVEGQT